MTGLPVHTEANDPLLCGLANRSVVSAYAMTDGSGIFIATVGNALAGKYVFFKLISNLLLFLAALTAAHRAKVTVSSRCFHGSRVNKCHQLL